MCDDKKNIRYIEELNENIDTGKMMQLTGGDVIHRRKLFGYDIPCYHKSFESNDLIKQQPYCNTYTLNDYKAHCDKCVICDC